MKKLMIAAAAVAMIGAAEAIDYKAYDFTATVKTTKGKGGKDITQTLNLGTDGSTFWYKEPGLTNILAQCGVLTNKADDVTVPAIIKTDKGLVAADGAQEVAPGTGVTLNDLLIAVAQRYDQKSAGKWCETVKIVDKAVCYRVAGTEKFSFVLAQTNCCNNAGNNFDVYFEKKDGTRNLVNNSYLNYDPDYSDGANDGYFLQRFGAQTSDRANKCELYGAFYIPDSIDTRLAGQGVVDMARGEIKSLSGNIVGFMSAPTCENCCKDPSKSIAFDCLNGTTAKKLKYTAIFGSFRIKRNARKDFTQN